MGEKLFCDGEDMAMMFARKFTETVISGPTRTEYIVWPWGVEIWREYEGRGPVEYVKLFPTQEKACSFINSLGGGQGGSK